MKKTLALLLVLVLAVALLGGCTETPAETSATEEATTPEETTKPAETTTEEETTKAPETTETEEETTTEAETEPVKTDQELADEVAALIDAIYVQERTDDTDAQCAAAKAAWDALTDAQKELVEGEFADPDYFGRDTGDASKDDPRNADDIGDKELLVVSFGTSFNDSRAQDIGGIEAALEEAYPDWAVRRAFTAQIIINHVQARDSEFIDNVDQALQRAVDNGVKYLVIQPTHLMHGAEYDELCEAVEAYAEEFKLVLIAEPLLGEVGADASEINEDKERVAVAVTAEAVKEAGYESLEEADEDGTAFVFMGHGTAHVAKVTYSQMQTQMEELGYKNVFIGTVEGEPEETACEEIINKVHEAGYSKVVLRPLMVVAGDHANNDMAGDDEDSWKSMFEASEYFDSIDCQISGLGRIEDVQALYVEHAGVAVEEADARAADQEKADEVAALIDAIYVQERTDETDEQCKAAKEAWDALTDEQKELVEGEDADPDYFGRDTGDASKDEPRNADDIGENELLVVSFGTSFNDSRATDIGGIEEALEAAFPDWSVRRAFTAQIIINHVQARDDEFIDNMDQALQRAVDNGVKNLVIQPTHLMHGAEYDELCEAVEAYADEFDTIKIAEPLLGEVGDDATVINKDKERVAIAVTAEAVDEAGYDSLAEAEEEGVAFVFMGHGTAHVAKVTYSQMQTQMEELGYKNVFIGTVEGEPEETACEEIIDKVHEAGYSKVVLRPLMVVAGDHANNDMAGDDEDSWKSMFEASEYFDEIDCQISGLGRIDAVEALYVEHAGIAVTLAEMAGMDSQEKADLVAELIDEIYVQERTDETDAQCAVAKAAWDALTDEEKELVEGEEADPDYFGRDTGDASLDDPRNANNIGENELLVVSFGTSFNDSRAEDIGGIEAALEEAFPDWAVRRAFTAQIIINHVQAREGEYIDNMEQAMERAIANGVKNLVIQPTHLMHGAEYDELAEVVEEYSDEFENIVIAEPLLGEVGADASVINPDKELVAKAVTAAALDEAGYSSLHAAEKDGTAFVFMGHGTAHVAKVTYSQMQTQMNELGYTNVFIGTVEGEPEETACEEIIEAVHEAGFTNVILRPLMVVAGDHANNDMAGDDEDSWKSMFEASEYFDSVECQISGLGRIEEVQALYVEHAAAVIDEIDISSPEEDDETGETGELEDGVYMAEFNTDSGMFHVNEACEGLGKLTVENGEMTIHVSLVSKKIVNLFYGLAEDAKKDGAELIEPTTDEVTYSDGTTEEVYGFDIPVPALDEEFDVALIGTAGKWYDHKVSVSNPVPVE